MGMRLVAAWAAWAAAFLVPGAAHVEAMCFHEFARHFEPASPRSLEQLRNLLHARIPPHFMNPQQFRRAQQMYWCCERYADDSSTRWRNPELLGNTVRS